MSGILQDIRCGFRNLCRTPGFTAGVAIILALGIGVNTAIFSVANWVMFRQIPGVRAPEQIVDLTYHTRDSEGIQIGYDHTSFSSAEIDEIRKQTADVFSDVSPYQEEPADALTVDGATELSLIHI